MSVPAWPVTLPQELLQRGYSQSAADLLIKSGTDAGPGKVRRRATAGVEPVTGNLVLTEAEVVILWTFFYNDLMAGALRFSWLEPTILTYKEFRFTSPPKRSMDGGLYDVTIELEMLP